MNDTDTLGSGALVWTDAGKMPLWKSETISPGAMAPAGAQGVDEASHGAAALTIVRETGGGGAAGPEIATALPFGSLAAAFDRLSTPEKPEETGAITMLASGPSGIAFWFMPVSSTRIPGPFVCALLTPFDDELELESGFGAMVFTVLSNVRSN